MTCFQSAGNRTTRYVTLFDYIDPPVGRLVGPFVTGIALVKSFSIIHRV